ncbi:MAG: hypothetical protein ACM3OC_04220 [Deltaproteobacteria bacterium]
MRGLFLLSAAVIALFCAVPASAKDVGYYLELGDTQTVGKYTLKDGVIKVDARGTPLDGMQVIVPPGSYPVEQVFTIKYTKVRKASVRDYVISPLITIEGPVVPADGLIIVKIPCKLPENTVAMVFFYDDQEKFTKALPPASKEKGYVTGMTRILKDMVVVATRTSSLKQ